MTSLAHAGIIHDLIRLLHQNSATPGKTSR
ncbi:hypothetical protein SCANM63S_04831 [Streptomyces canarius]